MPKSLPDIIAIGENQYQDFKFEINDSRKIARSVSAFSNTKGGRLYIGIKDNGVIAGVRSEEEFYMIEAAANLYCKPVVSFEVSQWNHEGKVVLEISIPQSKNKPVLAQNAEGEWLAYTRVNDQNILANSVLIKYWRQLAINTGVLIRYSEKEKILFDFLERNGEISMSKFSKIAGLKRFFAEKIIVNLLLLNIIEIEISEKGYIYKQKIK